mgnify:CR=1 FL=1
MDIDELNACLEKMNNCLKYIVIEINKNENRNNEFYNKYEEQLYSVFSEASSKLVGILKEIYLGNLNEIKNFKR